jgi:gluconolactonase
MQPLSQCKSPSLFLLMLLAASVSVGDDKPAAKTREVETGDLKLTVPETWKQKTQIRDPRAEYVVFFFGKQGAGGVQANIGRWIGQFDAEGRKVRVVTGECKQGKYTLVDLTGTYKKPMGPPVLMKSTPMPGWRVLNVVVETESGPYFLKLDGPQKSIAAIEADFRASFGGKKESEKEQKAE